MDRIDLHAHSCVSDGTDTPAELIAAAAAAGLDAVAITDHDTVDGWDEAASAAAEHAIALVRGIEVTCRHQERSLHLLALLVDPSEGTALAQRLASLRASRVTRAQRMVELIAADYPLTWEDVLAASTRDGVAPRTLGRPHIADALVAGGVVPDRSAAFADILTRSEYRVDNEEYPAQEAIADIHAAGGVAIAAHVLSGARVRGPKREVGDRLESLIAAGVDGFEVDHREHDDAERALLREIVSSRGLIGTGGSDYHGSGKPNQLGENLTTAASLAAISERATSTTGVLHP